MAARDKIHNAVKQALIKDGWVITHDPLRLQYQNKRVEIDLGAEKLLTAERGSEKIAVEIKSFLSRSKLQDFKVLLGQYQIYATLIKELAPIYHLLIAIDVDTYEVDFEHPIIQLMLKQYPIPLVVVDVETEEIRQWIR